MKSRAIIILALAFTTACSAQTQTADGTAPGDMQQGAATVAQVTEPTRLQFALFHFTDDQVRVTVDGTTVFDRRVAAGPEAGRSGLAAVDWITLPPCSDIVVTADGNRTALRLCIPATARSVLISAGPPIVVTTSDSFQGID